ncbi:hypothetical protein [Pendulispora albinea]|uniref:LamG domain-containing protein n=1 Tax=Pendulispora albinea TaxID=2741071 RepID=A0ABZ2LVM7_9BACT
MNRRYAFLFAPICACSVLGASVFSSGCSSSNDNSPSASDAGSDVPPITIREPTPWSPAMLRPAFWLDGDNVILVDGAISQWSDTSGNNNHATQTTVSLRPGVVTINGRRAVSFNGETRMIIADSASLTWGTDDFAVFVALRYTDINHPQKVAGVIYAKNASNSPFPGVQLFATGLPSQFWAGTDADTRIKSTKSGAVGYADGQMHIAVLRRSGTSLELRVDGAVVGSLVNTKDVNTSGFNALIGGAPDVEFLKGDIALLLGIHGTVTDAQEIQVETYMRNRYGF